MGVSSQWPLGTKFPSGEGEAAEPQKRGLPRETGLEHQAGRFVLSSWVLWLSGRRARLPYGFLKDSWQRLSFSKDGVFSWKMKLAV